MDEARLIRFGAGKTHLGAAFHAQRLLVEIILGFVLWHTPKPASLGGGPRVPHRFPSANNQNLLFTGRTPFCFTSHEIIQRPVRPLVIAMDVTYYVALPFVVADDGVAAGEAVECLSANAAVVRAEALSRKPGCAGAIAFCRTGDPATGEFSDAKLIRKFGDVPDDLSTL